MSLEVDILEAEDVFLGEQRRFNFVVYTEGTTLADIEADPTANRQDITGWTIELDVRQRTADEADPPAIYKTSTDPLSIIIDDPVEGECHWHFDEADTTDLPPGDYRYTVWRREIPAVLTYGLLVLREPARTN